MLNRLMFGWSSIAVVAMTTSTALADDIDDALAKIGRAGPQAAGSVAAREARDLVASQGVEVLPKLLAAMDTSNIVAANWLRTAFDEIVERERKRRNRTWPDLRGFVSNPRHQGRARRLALDLVDRMDPTFRGDLIPRLLDDPEFRFDAVQAALDAGGMAEAAGDRETALREYERAFINARAAEQVTQSAAKLTAMGLRADIVGHLGFVVDWYLLGPFDAPEYSGFAGVFPPEEMETIDLDAQFIGQAGRTIAWHRHHATDPFGQLNLMTAIAPVKEAVGYAYSEQISQHERDGELRCGADDNCTVWLNGERVFGREQWLNGTRLDRFVVPFHLREGTNRLLVKICQGPQHKDPEVPNNWSLQLRFCDATGRGLELQSALPAVVDDGREN
jgi:hypothetical protein